MCDRPPGLLGWAFRPRNPMKNQMPELHGTASVSESDVTFALGCRPFADARGSVGRFLSGPPIPPRPAVGFWTLSLRSRSSLNPNTRFSVGSCRTIRPLAAPKAVRRLNSPRRASERVSTKPATFEHAIDNPDPSAPRTNSNCRCVSPTICWWNETARDREPRLRCWKQSPKGECK
jgi:hypothetical protein